MAAWIHRTLDVDKINPREGILVVFIDDLDHCLPAKTVQVLEAIKLFMDKEGCIFVLGADTEIIRFTVGSHYQNTKVTGENAKDYLEKVVQIWFELPPIISTTMRDFVKEQKEVDWDMRHQWQTLIAAGEINPRRVKVVINHVNLQWYMFKNSDERADRVDRGDFICWQTLMQAAPDNFKDRIFDIEDIDLRLKFVKDALS